MVRLSKKNRSQQHRSSCGIIKVGIATAGLLTILSLLPSQQDTLSMLTIGSNFELTPPIASSLSSLSPCEYDQRIIDSGGGLEGGSNEKARKRTAVIIFTHLINAHPSLDPVLEIVNGYRKFFKGLPKRAPLFITVDGIRHVPEDQRKGELFLMETRQNREKYDGYINSLNRHFKDQDNVRILIAGKNIGLANNIRRVIDNLSNDTKYMYLLQHDLPFIKEINHTDILATAEANDKLRIMGFKGEHPIDKVCGDDIISPAGMHFRRFKQWTDRNHFARVEHYANDVLPKAKSVFPEDNMHKPTRQNCMYFAPYYYNAGRGDPYYVHTDLSERYGFKLAERVKRGELDYSMLTDVNLLVMRQMGVNMTELKQYKK